MPNYLRKSVFCIAMAGSFISLVLLIFVYRNGLQSYDEKTLESQIEAMNIQCQSAVTDKIKSAKKELKTAAVIFEQYENLISDEVMNKLKDISIILDFSQLYLVNGDRTAVSADGNRIQIDIADDFCTEALSGKECVSEIKESIFQNMESIRIAVPVVHNSKVIGTVIGEYDTRIFCNFIDSRILNGTGYAYVFQSDGKAFKLSSQNDGFMSGDENIFDILRLAKYSEGDSYQHILDAIQEKQMIFTEFALGTQILNSWIAPTEINDWFIIMIIPQASVQYRSEAITTRIIWLTVIFSIFIVSLFVLNYSIDLRHKQAIKFERDTFMTATSMISYYVCELDIKTRTMRAISRQGSDMYGFPLVIPNVPESIIESGKVLPEYHESLRDMYRHIYEGEKFASTVIQVIRSDNETVWVRTYIKVVEQGSGKQKRAITIIEDIDDEKKKEQGYMEEIDELQEVCNYIAKNEYIHLIIINTVDNRIVRYINDFGTVNKKWEVFNGNIDYPTADVDSRDIGKLDILKDINAVKDRLLKNNGEFTVTFRTKSSVLSNNEESVWSAGTDDMEELDADIVWVELKCTYINEEKDSILLISRDMTGLFNSEMQSKKILENAAIKAEKASKAKGMFLSHMSHEMRTPMNAIIGMTALARKKADTSDKVSYYLNRIDSASKLLLALINDVLDMSAIESGKIKISMQPFNLRTTVSSLSTVFYEQCRQKVINFKTTVSEVENDLVIGDQLRVNQILMNLMSNAVKFTGSNGSVELHLSEKRISENMVEMTCIVRDTGCGMNKDMLSRLYKPFEQESSETAKKYGGSGLGMSITKSLVEMMNGSIEVQSEVNVGTVFTVCIPFETLKEDKQIMLPNRKDICVIAADVDENSLDYLTAILKRMSVSFKRAGTAAEMNDIIADCILREPKKKYICIIDWTLLDDNSQWLINIMNTYKDHEIHIAITAYDFEDVMGLDRKLETCVTLTKPVFQSVLVNMIMDLLGNGMRNTDICESDPVFIGKKVLLVEDNDINREIATELLETAGFEIAFGTNGKEAVRIFMESGINQFSAILMDIQMPEMDGYEATRIIRQMERPDAVTIPIIAMTADAFDEDVKDALKSGMTAHIAKPIDLKKMFDTLRGLL